MKRTNNVCGSSLTSPVIATCVGTVRPVSSDTSAQVIAVPALGPSFFCAPAGRCRCTSMTDGCLNGSCDRVSVIPRSYACRFTNVSASSALSRITSPRLPVVFSAPLPGTEVLSMGMMPPSPCPVTTRP